MKIRRKAVALCSALSLSAVIVPAANAQESSQPTEQSSLSATAAFQRPDASVVLPARLSDTVDIMKSDAQDNIRIPAITVAANGDVLASYDRRPKNGGFNGGDSPNANSIVQRRSTDNGKTWGEENVIAQGEVGPAKVGFSDPSYIVDKNTGTIFNFHVKSFDSGFFHNNPEYKYKADGSIDEEHRKTVNLGLAVSTDNGRTWENRVITDEVLRAVGGELQSGFATSGAGIQIEQGPYAGRLVQQYGWLTKDGRVTASSVFSDDGGKTWNIGNFTPAQSVDGQDLTYDENTVVELSDGSLLLNSRSNNGKRIFAKSTDGGTNWENAYYEEEFTDPGNPAAGKKPGDNNAELIRPFPNARPGTPESQVLLYSYTQGEGRTKGTIAASCDDGESWPVKKVFQPSRTGYTTMAVQEDGSIGLLYEPGGFSNIGYVNFTLNWVDENLCGGLAGVSNVPVEGADLSSGLS